MAHNQKRALVDLTGSDDEQPQHKAPRLANATGPRPQQPGRQYVSLLDDEDDLNGLMPMTQTQDVDNDGVAFVQLGQIAGKIVGIRYYNGYANPGENVVIRREPTNQYDSNAIRVDNVQGTQIGHIPKGVAAKLAPYMDARDIIVEGVLAGEKGFYDCPITLKLFGTSDPDARKELEARMKKDRVPYTKTGIPTPRPSQSSQQMDPPKKGRGYKSSQSNAGSSQPEPQPELSLQQLAQSSEQIRPRDMQELAEQWAPTEETLANMPMADQPEGLKATLLPYQRQGLAWMMSMENQVLSPAGSSEIVQLWETVSGRQTLYRNRGTNFTTSTKPALISGGILADDMGLGKTVQVISTILQGGKGQTLIIAPVSVMSNWSQQIERHVKEANALKVVTWHGTNKNKKEVSTADVVVTSYGTLIQEFSNKGVLFSTNWRRVVLDEGHTIRNPKTKNAVACCNLKAQSRWVLTGTPIVNSIKDLYSMLKFLRITGGLEQLEIFNSVLTRPLASGDKNAEILLQMLMRSTSLRRRKDMKFVDLKLPELTEYVHKIPFRQDEKKKYDAFQAEAKGMLSKYEASGGKKAITTYRNLLEILLRMRQVCCHWKLCGERVNDLLSLIDDSDVVELNDQNRLALQQLLQISIDSQDECAICLDDLHNPVITACKHVFGYECIERVIATQAKCPMCRAPMNDVEQLVHPAAEVAEDDPSIDIDTQSSKTEALISILQASRKDPLSKVVIFSQWTSFLNVIQKQLDVKGWKYTRIDGTMKASSRDAAMTSLESDTECRILLASLSVASVGLNLVAADTVILADSWWAPAIEDQAVDRVHRLGQTRKTTVWRLLMEDSIEQRVVDIQSEKRKLVGKAFQEKGNREKGGRVTRLGDIQKLLS